MTLATSPSVAERAASLLHWISMRRGKPEMQRNAQHLPPSLRRRGDDLVDRSCRRRRSRRRRSGVASRSPCPARRAPAPACSAPAGAAAAPGAAASRWPYRGLRMRKLEIGVGSTWKRRIPSTTRLPGVSGSCRLFAVGARGLDDHLRRRCDWRRRRRPGARAPTADMTPDSRGSCTRSRSNTPPKSTDSTCPALSGLLRSRSSSSATSISSGRTTVTTSLPMPAAFRLSPTARKCLPSRSPSGPRSPRNRFAAPRKVATKRVAGRRYSVSARPVSSSRPLFMMPMRSASANASS